MCNSLGNDLRHIPGAHTAVKDAFRPYDHNGTHLAKTVASGLPYVHIVLQALFYNLRLQGFNDLRGLSRPASGIANPDDRP